MSVGSSWRYLFVAIDQAALWVFVQFKANKIATSAKAFLNALHKAWLSTAGRTNLLSASKPCA